MGEHKVSYREHLLDDGIKMILWHSICKDRWLKLLSADGSVLYQHSSLPWWGSRLGFRGVRQLARVARLTG